MEDADDRWLERLGLDPEGPLQDVQHNLGAGGNEKRPGDGKTQGSPGPGEPFE